LQLLSIAETDPASQEVQSGPFSFLVSGNGSNVSMPVGCGSRGGRSIFMGDGPNDEGALSCTEHSVAIASGSLAAKNASNVEVVSSTALPDLVTLSRLFHGGRAIILRDIVFVGSYIVVMLAVAAHITRYYVYERCSNMIVSHGHCDCRYTPMGSRIMMIEDPWTPLNMMVGSGCINRSYQGE
jgi:hypothetical protein